jgi:branched-chain amino acid aminotransferase
MLNQYGQLAEATGANLFVVREGQLLTPPTTDGALDGITRATLLGLAKQVGIPSEVRSLGRLDVFAADEVFLSGTGAGGLVRVIALDGERVGTPEVGPVHERLAAALDALRKAG